MPLKINYDIKDLFKLDGQYGCGFCFKYNHIYILEKCNRFITERLEKDYLLTRKENAEIEYIKTHYYPIINLTLRCGEHRHFRNQKDFFVKLIQKILEEYPKAYFFF